MKTREEYAKLAEGHATVALTSNSAVSATVALTYATLATVAPRMTADQAESYARSVSGVGASSTPVEKAD